MEQQKPSRLSVAVARLIRGKLLLVCVVMIHAIGIAKAAGVMLEWDPNPESYIAGYNVYRSDQSGVFTSAPLNGTTPLQTTSFTDSSATSGIYFYVVRAVGSNGQESAPSNEVEARLNTSVPDALAPTVSITAPAQNEKVSGSSVTISAAATDNVGVAGVQFSLDGVNLGAERITSPYSMLWDTAQVTNGSHTLTAVARDVAGNKTTSASVIVAVNNAADKGAPIIVITAPGPNSTVNTTVPIAVTAWDNVGITVVQFKLDGLNLGAEQIVAPYSMTWDTTQTSNGSHTLTAVARDAAGNETTSVPVTVTVSNTSNSTGKKATVRYFIPTLGAQHWVMSDISAPMAVGYARVQPDSTTNALAGVAIFSYYSGDLLVSQASVPLSDPVQSGRIYAEINNVVNTGVAFANPTDEDAAISFSFVDKSGRDVTSGLLLLGAKRQFSGFLTEAPFNLRDNMEGSFTFKSTRNVSVIALRGFTNERGEFLMTTLPVVSASGYNTSAIVPHFAVGDGWITKLVLMNPTSTTIFGRVEFMDAGSVGGNASPLTVIANEAQTSNFNYSIPANGIMQVTLKSIEGHLTGGSVRLTSANTSSTPAGLAIFSFSNGGITVSEAGVTIDKPDSTFHLYAEAYGTPFAIGSFQTGIALANTMSYPVVANLELRPLDGTDPPLQGSVTIPAGGQIARFLKELIPSTPDTFRGLLRVRATGSVGTIGLRLSTNARGDSLITTIPAATETELPTTDQQFFPHVVAGGGFTTEVVIYSRASGLPTSGTLTFSARDGSPLPLMK